MFFVNKYWNRGFFVHYLEISEEWWLYLTFFDFRIFHYISFIFFFYECTYHYTLKFECIICTARSGDSGGLRLPPSLSMSTFRAQRRPQTSVSRFDTRTLCTQRQQQYVSENGCACSVVCLLFAVVLWDFSGFLSLIRSLQPEQTQRTTANSRHYAARATILTYVLLLALCA